MADTTRDSVSALSHASFAPIVEISAPSDLTLRVSYKNVSAEGEPVQTCDLLVDRKTVTGISDWFLRLLRGSFKEGSSTVVEMEEVKPVVVEIIMRLKHDADAGAICLPKLPLEDLWDICEAAQRYFIDYSVFGKWFANWYFVNPPKGIDGHRAMLFPCHAFSHAKGFQTATKFLVYHDVRHITEDSRQRHRQLHLPNRVIGQMNAAKGRLKTILHGPLYEPIEKLLDHDKCNCKEQTAWDYQMALHDTGAWPLEAHWHKDSAAGILYKLGKFAANHYEDKDECSSYCPLASTSQVERARKKTQDYFDGLCLDCMHCSHFEDTDEDYWRHDEHGVDWDRGCRITHGEPTWYFSFTGREEKRIAHNKTKRARRFD